MIEKKQPRMVLCGSEGVLGPAPHGHGHGADGGVGFVHKGYRGDNGSIHTVEVACV